MLSNPDCRYLWDETDYPYVDFLKMAEGYVNYHVAAFNDPSVAITASENEGEDNI